MVFELHLKIRGVIFLTLVVLLYFYYNSGKIPFEGDEFWTNNERNLCDDQELEETWQYAESICLTYVQNFELVKVEVMSWEPALVIYRDFFTKKQVDDYLELLENQPLEEQQVVLENGTDSYSKVRRANGTFINPQDYPASNSIVQTAVRLIPMIDFETAAEALIALSYNKGGHYAVHYDYLEYDDESVWDHWMKEYGNRLATFIMVFKTADSGGATLFPSLGTAVRANPGDAFLWFNSRGDLGQEDYSDHGGCPVYSGTKIISTIWIRQKGQKILEQIVDPGFIPADVLIPEN